jgi:hypothetical protein
MQSLLQPHAQDTLARNPLIHRQSTYYTDLDHRVVVWMSGPQTSTQL